MFYICISDNHATGSRIISIITKSCILSSIVTAPTIARLVAVRNTLIVRTIPYRDPHSVPAGKGEHVCRIRFFSAGVQLCMRDQKWFQPLYGFTSALDMCRCNHRGPVTFVSAFTPGPLYHYALTTAIRYSWNGCFLFEALHIARPFEGSRAQLRSLGC